MTLRGLECSETNGTLFGAPGPTVAIDGCGGTVAFEECVVKDGHPALRVVQCDKVFINKSSFQGGDGALQDNVMIGVGAGIRITDSKVAIYDSQVVGGDGAIGQSKPVTVPSGSGGDAILVQTSFVTVANCSLQGGDGAAAYPVGNFSCPNPGYGGAAVRVNGLQSSVYVLFTLVSPGITGALLPGCPVVPILTDSYEAAPETLFLLPYSAHEASVESPVRAGQSVQLSFVGEPSEPVLLFFSGSADFTTFPKMLDVLLPGAPFQWAYLGNLGGNGQMGFSIKLPLLPPGLDAATIFTQAAFAKPSGHIFMAGPSTLTVIHQQF